MQLVDVIEGELPDSFLGSVAKVALRLAWLGINDAARIYTNAKDLLDFGLGSAVEPAAKSREEPKNMSIRIRFDS